MLLDAGSFVDHATQGGATALFMAAGSGRIALVRQLLVAGCDVHQATYQGVTPLYYAAEEGHAGGWICKTIFWHASWMCTHACSTGAHGSAGGHGKQQKKYDFDNNRALFSKCLSALRFLVGRIWASTEKICGDAQAWSGCCWRQGASRIDQRMKELHRS